MGDLIVLYTDGIVEATNAQEELFGYERLEKLIVENVSRSAQEVLRAIRQSLFDFTGEQPIADDTTVVVGKVNG